MMQIHNCRVARYDPERRNRQMEKQKKKIICLSRFDYINSLLKIRCDYTGEAEKDVFGKAILNELLPMNPQLRSYAEIELFPDGEFDTEAHGFSKSHVSNATAALCDGISGNSLDYSKVKSHVKPLLSFAMNCEFQNRTILTNDVALLHHLLAQIKSVKELLEKINDESLDKYHEFPHKDIPADTFSILNYLIEDLEKNTEESLEDINDSTWLAMLFKIMLDNWDDVFIYCSQFAMDRPFRMLGDVCRISNWNDSVKTRYQLLEIMKSFD